MLLVGVIAAALVLAGCSSGAGGVPSPPPNTSGFSLANTSIGSPSNGEGVRRAPTVSDPLDASKFEANPCSALTADQLANISLTNLHSSPTSSVGDPLCTWSDETSSDSIGVTWMSTPGSGLSLDYSEKSSFAYFQPTMVGSYPAVFDDVADLRAQGTCALSVGVSNTLAFIAKYDSESAATKTQACQLAKQAASQVIKNLGGS